MATISTHNGSAAHRDHNIRGHSTDKQNHINKNAIHEIWVDEAPREAYDRIFGDALEEYNAKQNRPERIIKDYYNKVNQDEKKHPVYEMIVGVYGGVSADTSKQIMRDFVDGWKQRNPNLELIGAYYHADEEGEPHIHLDYIPVAKGYTRGMKVQNGLVKALGQQGFVKQGKETAQIQWQKSENLALEEICMNYGIEVEHPQKNKGVEHLHTEAFKTKQEINKELDALNQQIQEDMDLIESYDQNIVTKTNELEQLTAEIDETQQQVDYLNNELATLEQFQSTLTRDLKLLELQAREPIEVLAETEEKTRFGKTIPATVTIRKDDYDKLAELQTINKRMTHLQTVLNSFLNGSKSLLSRLDNDLHLRAIKNAFNSKIRHINSELDQYKKSVSVFTQENWALKNQLGFKDRILESVETEISASTMHRIKAKICKNEYESSWHKKTKTDKELGITTNKVFMPIDSMEPMEELDFLKAYKSYCDELGEGMDQDMAAQYDQLLQIDKAIDEVMLESFAEWHQEQGRGR